MTDAAEQLPFRTDVFDTASKHECDVIPGEHLEVEIHSHLRDIHNLDGGWLNTVQPEDMVDLHSSLHAHRCVNPLCGSADRNRYVYHENGSRRECLNPWHVRGGQDTDDHTHATMPTNHPKLVHHLRSRHSYREVDLEQMLSDEHFTLHDNLHGITVRPALQHVHGMMPTDPHDVFLHLRVRHQLDITKLINLDNQGYADYHRQLHRSDDAVPTSATPHEYTIVGYPQIHEHLLTEHRVSDGVLAVMNRMDMVNTHQKLHVKQEPRADRNGASSAETPPLECGHGVNSLGDVHGHPELGGAVYDRAGHLLIQVDRNGAPMPEPSTGPIVHVEVMRDIADRLRLGVRRYGQPLQPHNGRNALQDIYEELLDAACYVKQKLLEDAGSRPQHDGDGTNSDRT
jgi:hypothetical protein